MAILGLLVVVGVCVRLVNRFLRGREGNGYATYSISLGAARAGVRRGFGDVLRTLD
jgi:hypothetical protein